MLFCVLDPQSVRGNFFSPSLSRLLLERQDPENVRFLCFFVTVLALFAKRNLVNRELFKESDLGGGC